LGHFYRIAYDFFVVSDPRRLAGGTSECGLKEICAYFLSYFQQLYCENLNEKIIMTEYSVFDIIPLLFLLEQFLD
jgi:hypothetical protein